LARRELRATRHRIQRVIDGCFQRWVHEDHQVAEAVDLRRRFGRGSVQRQSGGDTALQKIADGREENLAAEAVTHRHESCEGIAAFVALVIDLLQA
jgi:hypothetical protein